MTDLLSRDEYKKIAATLPLPSIASSAARRWRPARAGPSRPSTRPTGKVLARLPACGAEDVDAAVASARAAFEDGRWSKLHPAERKAALLRLAEPDRGEPASSCR